MAEVAGLRVTVGWDNAEVQKGIREFKALMASVNKTGTPITSSIFKNAQKEINESTPAIKILRKELADAKTVIDSLAAANGRNAALVKQAAQHYNSMSDRLKTATGAAKYHADEYSRISVVYEEAARHARNMAVQFGVSSKEFETSAGRAANLKAKLNEVSTAMSLRMKIAGLEGLDALEAKAGRLKDIFQKSLIDFKAGNIDAIKLEVDRSAYEQALTQIAVIKRESEALSKKINLSVAVENGDVVKQLEADVKRAKEVWTASMANLKTGKTDGLTVEVNKASYQEALLKLETIKKEVSEASRSVRLKIDPPDLSAFAELKKKLADVKAAYADALATGKGGGNAEVKRLAGDYHNLQAQVERVSRSLRSKGDAYGRLQQLTNMATRHAQNMAAAYGKESEAAVGAAKRAQEYTNRLKEIDAASGRHFRNVGNYADGMVKGFAQAKTQMGFMATEIPNFFLSARTGMMSLSNNLPMFFNSMGEAISGFKAKNAALAASGVKTKSVFRSMLGVFNPWQLAIGLGVGLLTAYGPKLLELAKSTDKFAEELKKLKKENEELNGSLGRSKRELDQYKESLEYIKKIKQNKDNARDEYAREVAQLELLNTVLKSNITSNKHKNEAIEQIKQMYPQYNVLIDQEYQKTGNLTNLITEKLIPALYQKSLAMAAASNFEDYWRKRAKEEADIAVFLKRNKENIDRYNALKSVEYKTQDQRAEYAQLAAVGAAYELAKKSHEKRLKDIEDEGEAQKKVFEDLSKSLGQLDLPGTSIYKREKKLDRVENAGNTKEKISEATNAAKRLKETLEENQRELESIDRQDISVFDKLQQKIGLLNKQKFELHNKFKLSFDRIEIKDIDAELAKAAKELPAAFKDYVKEMDVNAALNVKAGISTDVEEIKGEISSLKQKLRDAGNETLVLEVQAEIKLKQNSLKNADIAEALKKYTDQEITIAFDVENNYSDGLDSLQAQIKNTEELIRSLQGLKVSPDFSELVQAKETLKNLKLDELLAKLKEKNDGFDGDLRQVDLLKNTGILDAGEALKKSKQILQRQRDALIEVFNTLPSGTLADGIRTQIESIDGALSSVNIEQKLALLNEKLKNSVAELGIDIASTIGEGIGSGDFSGMFDGIKSGLGRSLQDFGKWIITESIKMKILTEVLKKNILNPAVAIPAGIALIALGAAISASTKKRVKETKAFADGGIVYGPTNALVGEYPGATHNPEIIAPLDKLRDMMPDSPGGGDVLVTVKNEVTPRGLVTMVERAQKLIKR